ncbi:hypothetical protein AB1283_00965 [Bacillus sp. S13(2024)]|uniref:hypothetical protein n=1 Tax=Bacillus sp. S13(2024) TaxID=3162885 RepID=UPI003D1F4E2F
MKAHTKNDYIQESINIYFKILWREGKEVDKDELIELIKQWDYDYEMNKLHMGK